MDLKTTLKVCFIVVIETIFCFTPLGTIPIGPIAATLSMIPVIIASLTFGKKVGMLVGGIFGLYSFIYWTFIMPAFPTAFLFTPFSEATVYKGNVGSIVICFLPRILAGFMPSQVSEIFVGKDKKKNIKLDMISSIIGSMTNTLLVLGLVFIIFGKEYSLIMEKSILVILMTTILTNGIPEAVISAIVCPIVAKVLRDI